MFNTRDSDTTKIIYRHYFDQTSLGLNSDQIGWVVKNPANADKITRLCKYSGKGRVRAAYGRNYERLAAIKNKYNPNNLFRNLNINPKLKNI